MRACKDFYCVRIADKFHDFLTEFNLVPKREAITTIVRARTKERAITAAINPLTTTEIDARLLATQIRAYYANHLEQIVFNLSEYHSNMIHKDTQEGRLPYPPQRELAEVLTENLGGTPEEYRGIIRLYLENQQFY